MNMEPKVRKKSFTTVEQAIHQVRGFLPYLVTPTLGLYGKTKSKNQHNCIMKTFWKDLKYYCQKRMEMPNGAEIHTIVIMIY